MSTLIENYKITKTEEELETKFFHQLENLGFTRADITNEKELKDNLKVQLEKFNREVLKSLNKTEFSNSEFTRIWNHLDKGTTYNKALKLRDRFSLKLDNGNTKNIRFFNSKKWCKNEYQVTRQLTIERTRKHRYDVVLLINGLPLVLVELKNNGHKLKEGWEQIKKYRKFTIKGSIMNYVQIFIVSNGVDTIYFANNDKQSFKQVITWADFDNNKINSLCEFTDTFLEKCAVSKVIAKNVILENVNKRLMIMRPYQIHAFEKMIEKVNTSNTGGVIWHTTGSGKTLTSFVASRVISTLPNVHKTIFVVDRNALDGQTKQQFDSFEEGCVSSSHNTKNLLDNLNDPNKRFIITTMQKINYLLITDNFKNKLKPFGNKKTVMIFDECHRSTFGKTFQLIKKEFNNPQLFGFTGTPIFEDNKKNDDATTKSLFGDILHKYNITDAVKDQKVLGFSLENRGRFFSTIETEEEAKDVVSDIVEHEEQFLNDERITKISKEIIENHHIRTRDFQYCGLFAVNSIPMLMKYYREMKKIEKNFKIAVLFSFDPSEPEVEFDGYDDSDIMLEVEEKSYRNFMEKCLVDYNNDFGSNFNINQMKEYSRDVQRRHSDKNGDLSTSGENISLLIVVNMLLTGYDAPKINTLYLDKPLQYQGLVQAFSRTNRIVDKTKPFGLVISYRNLEHKAKIAFDLYGNDDPKNNVLRRTYEEYLEEMKTVVKKVRSVAKTANDIDNIKSEKKIEILVTNFKRMNRLKIRMSTFLDFRYEHFGFTYDEWREYVTKYMDLGDRFRGKAPIQSTKGFIDFDIDSITTDLINVDYLNQEADKVILCENPIQADNKIDKIGRNINSKIDKRSKKEIIESFLKQLKKYVAYLNGEYKPTEEELILFKSWEEYKHHKEVTLFEKYKDTEQEREISVFCEELKLNKTLIKEIFSEYVYSEDVPVPSKIRKTFLEDNLTFMEQVKKEKETLEIIKIIKDKYVWD